MLIHKSLLKNEKSRLNFRLNFLTYCMEVDVLTHSLLCSQFMYTGIETLCWFVTYADSKSELRVILDNVHNPDRLASHGIESVKIT